MVEPFVTFLARGAGSYGLLALMKKLVTLLSAVLLCAASSVRAADAPKVIDVKVTGHGQPVILIPGLATPGAVWDDTVKHLQDKYECHVVTIAGFGGMAPVKTDDLLGEVRDQLIAYAREHKLEKPAIIGHSLGGTLALAIGETAPELPGQIICVDGLPFTAAAMMPGVHDVEGAKKAATAWREQMKGQTGESFAHYQRKVVIPAMVIKPEDVQRIAEMCGKSDPATVGQGMNELLTRDLRPDLGKIKCPILVLGALAQLIQYAPEAALEQNYKTQFTNAPQTRFQFFPKSKHFIMIDDPVRFYAVLDKELAAH
ncbi:MAG TPA: alpha/beta hydrolase [Chthoniobacterales bacterium]|nr:alpha/beta hydrolase [Chthoniobacterales bacterium]